MGTFLSKVFVHTVFKKYFSLYEGSSVRMFMCVFRLVLQIMKFAEMIC
jgi:hypothetical protein